MQAGFAQRVKTILSSFLHSEKDERKKESKNEQRLENQRADAEDSVCSKSPPKRSPQVNSQLLTHARDRVSYFDRVETYSALTWFAKPLSLCPLYCARYGWKNTDVDMLRCVSCKALLCGSLSQTCDPDIYTESCKKVAESLVTAHSSICPWPSNPSPAHFMSILYPGREEALEDLLSRYRNLRKLGFHLPKLNTQELDGVDIQALCLLVKQHCSNGRVTADSNKDVTVDDNKGVTPDLGSTDEVSCVLALCGWETSSLKKTEILICPYCRRQIGLWNFISHNTLEPQPVIENGRGSVEEGTDGPCTKKRKLLDESIERTFFDPIGEHRTWCPWISANQHQEDKSTPQKLDEGTNRPGWKKLLDFVIPASSNPDNCSPKFMRNVKTTPPSEGLRSIRKVLHDWSSPAQGKL